ncbi:MAG: hypothetical protein FD133_1558 [Erysipelotrichaceae bacterium]|nr:MAG: hypothetical protein FD179_1692 [Erysipelotrichaceae bacterium]TXT17086.1 MAG: hypothetical protein FD133_1558 [Erysipelotrichaceae bacterium]
MIQNILATFAVAIVGALIIKFYEREFNCVSILSKFLSLKMMDCLFCFDFKCFTI